MRSPLLLQQSWRDLGACRGIDPEIFYPGDDAADDDVEAAKDICGGCAVQESCLEHALSSRERDGIWGGATERERRRIVRQRRRAS